MVRLSSILLGVIFFALSSAASPITLSLSPVTQNGTFPGEVEVEIVAAGLTDATAPSLSTYDLDVAFDPSLLAVSNVEYGDRNLGNQLDVFGSGTLQFTTIGATSVNLFELSYDFPDDLNSFQAGDFTLAYIRFSTLGSGIASLTLTVNALGDAWGDPLEASPIANATVSITGATSVPEPGTLALLGLASGLLALFGRQARRN